MVTVGYEWEQWVILRVVTVSYGRLQWLEYVMLSNSRLRVVTVGTSGYCRLRVSGYSRYEWLL